MRLTLLKNQKLWATSDTHYSHANICSATTKWSLERANNHIRKFTSLDEMNTTLVNNINSVVAPDDILFHIGDWSFGGIDKISEFRNRIHCKNIHLIFGNHDHHILNDRDGVRSLFASTKVYTQLDVKWNDPTKLRLESASFILMHYPIASWDGMARGVYHLHGHVHLPESKRIGPGRMMDVGVDGNNLNPIELSEIIALLKDREIKGLLEIDHHEEQTV